MIATRISKSSVVKAKIGAAVLLHSLGALASDSEALKAALPNRAFTVHGVGIEDRVFGDRIHSVSVLRNDDGPFVPLTRSDTERFARLGGEDCSVAWSKVKGVNHTPRLPEGANDAVGALCTALRTMFGEHFRGAGITFVVVQRESNWEYRATAPLRVPYAPSFLLQSANREAPTLEELNGMLATVAHEYTHLVMHEFPEYGDACPFGEEVVASVVEAAIEVVLGTFEAPLDTDVAPSDVHCGSEQGPADLRDEPSGLLLSARVARSHVAAAISAARETGQPVEEAAVNLARAAFEDRSLVQQRP